MPRLLAYFWPCAAILVLSACQSDRPPKVPAFIVSQYCAQLAEHGWEAQFEQSFARESSWSDASHLFRRGADRIEALEPRVPDGLEPYHEAYVAAMREIAGILQSKGHLGRRTTDESGGWRGRLPSEVTFVVARIHGASDSLPTALHTAVNRHDGCPS